MSDLRWTDTVGAPSTLAEARLELAAVCRLVAREDMAPIGAARFAARDPERVGVYLANPGGLLLDEISASKLIAVDQDGVRLEDGKPEPDAGALALVLAALEAKPNAVAAAQVATTAGCAVASLQDGLIPMTQTTFMFHGAIGAHDWDPAATHDVVRAQVAADIADGLALLVRGRGLLVTGTTLAQTWKLLFFLNKCCRSQIDAMAAVNGSGRPLTLPAKAVIDHAVCQSRAFIAHARFVADWPSYLDQLDREDPSYRS
jgi:ribulose-5-phosphate 4-epimerase/fuculose-1-phosphate aldolase